MGTLYIVTTVILVIFTILNLRILNAHANLIAQQKKLINSAYRSFKEEQVYLFKLRQDMEGEIRRTKDMMSEVRSTVNTSQANLKKEKELIAKLKVILRSGTDIINNLKHVNRSS